MAAKSSEKITTVEWTGSAGIESAKSLQKELLKALKANTTVYLDISSLEDIDITGIQIILAAKKEADNLKKVFAITGSIPQPISEFVEGCSISFDSLVLPENTEKEAE